MVKTTLIEGHKITVSAETVMAVLERNARAAATRAGEAAGEIAKSLAPRAARHRTGQGRGKRLSENVQVRTRRTSLGLSTVVQPDLRESFYAGLVNGGTAKMEARPYIDETRELATPGTERILEDGQHDAGEDLRRLLG